jgi:hypothetical protein
VSEDPDYVFVAGGTHQRTYEPSADIPEIPAINAGGTDPGREVLGVPARDLVAAASTRTPALGSGVA